MQLKFTHFQLRRSGAVMRVFSTFDRDFFHCWYLAALRFVFRWLSRGNGCLSLYYGVFVWSIRYLVGLNSASCANEHVRSLDGRNLYVYNIANV